MEIVLAIDGGGSRTRCLAVTREGQIVGAAESGPSNHLLVPRDVVVASLAAATGKALTQSESLPEQVVCLSAGMAGVDYDKTGARKWKMCFARSVLLGC